MHLSEPPDPETTDSADRCCDDPECHLRIAEQLARTAPDDDDGEDEWEPWGDEDWLRQDDDGTAEASRWWPVVTITPTGGVL